MKVRLHIFVGLAALSLLALPCVVSGQSIQGKWQLVRQSDCLESELPAGDENPTDEGAEELVSAMKQMSSPAPQVVVFREKGLGEESTRILSKKRAANKQNFMYKLTGQSLYILDKKSQTLTETFSIDKLSADSLILSNSARPCETRVFLKIKDPR